VAPPERTIKAASFPAISFSAVNQFLTGDAIANPWNRLKPFGLNLLLAVEALAERALTDPFQRGIDGTQ
jgi:hypothetical protein